jgi:hypothetical protein
MTSMAKSRRRSEWLVVAKHEPKLVCACQFDDLTYHIPSQVLSGDHPVQQVSLISAMRQMSDSVWTVGDSRHAASCARRLRYDPSADVDTLIDAPT